MKPIVGIIMGSESDLPVMQEAANMMNEFAIPYEITVVSAHRTPERMYEYATSAEKKGLNVIIAGAGGAAHLPGMVASLTSIPVIGVPIQTKALHGVDSLYSIAQMPPGIPVATMAINGAKNAGIFAASIVGLLDKTIMDKLKTYKEKMKENVLDMAKDVENTEKNRKT